MNIKVRLRVKCDDELNTALLSTRKDTAELAQQQDVALGLELSRHESLNWANVGTNQAILPGSAYEKHPLYVSEALVEWHKGKRIDC